MGAYGQNDTDYIALDEQPPSFKEIEPLLLILSKYIRDALRKKKKKYMKKSDYLKNIIKYLQDAVDKRHKSLSGRQSKLQQFTSPTPTSSADNVSDFEYKMDEEDAEEEKYMKLLDKNAMLAPMRENLLSASHIELQSRIDSYVPRTSDNRYRLTRVDQNGSDESENEEKTPPLKMKIDSGMAKLQKKRESQRLIFSSLAKESAAKTSVILSAIDDEKILQADEEQKSPSIHVQNDT